MTVSKLNDAPVLDQTQGFEMKLLMFIVWKLTGDKGVTITSKDMEQCVKQFEPSVPALIMHGTHDGFSFRVASMEEGIKAAEHHEAMQSKKLN